MELGHKRVAGQYLVHQEDTSAFGERELVLLQLVASVETAPARVSYKQKLETERHPCSRRDDSHISIVHQLMCIQRIKTDQSKYYE